MAQFESQHILWIGRRKPSLGVRCCKAASAAGTVAIAGCSGSSEETSDPETDSETNGNKTNDGESERSRKSAGSAERRESDHPAR